MIPNPEVQDLCNNQPYDPGASIVVYMFDTQDPMQFPYRLYEDPGFGQAFNGQDLWWWNFNLNIPIFIDSNGTAQDFFQC
jgi:hypothetical protein